MAYAKIRPRRGTEYEWSSYNPVLEEGELGVQFPDTGIGKGLCKFKIGDGVTPWNQLAFAFDGTAAAAIDGGGINPSAIIQLRTATANTWHNTNPILAEREIAYCSDEGINSIKIGDGLTRWDDLPYIRASALVENNNNYDFGSEDDDLETVTSMENYVNNNTGFDPDVFENYNGRRPDFSDQEEETEEPEENTEEPVGNSAEETTEEPVVEEPEEETPTEEEPTEEPVETAGLKDLVEEEPKEEE